MLCAICERVVQDFWQQPEKDRASHHPTYSSLLTSATEGCRICCDIEDLIVGDDIRNAVEAAIMHGDSFTEMTFSRSEGGPESIPKITLSLVSEAIHVACGLYKKSESYQILDYSAIPAAATDISRNAEEHSPSVALPNSTGSSQTMSLIEKWIDVCTRTHEACHIARDDLWIPSRVLELGTSPEDPTLRLRTRFQDANIHYLTLSHRWGDLSLAQFKLTTDSYKSLREGIAIETLPRTFQDTIDIARRLGFRYLWIDCLCILQDDPEDWRKESALMGKIYTNGHLNIAATWAVDSSKGCFMNRDLSRVATYFKGPSHDPSGSTTWVMTRRSLWQFEVELAPLSRRGWVMQERILSPRVVYFAEKQVFWECRHSKACESFPSGAHALDAYQLYIAKTLVPGNTWEEYLTRTGRTPAYYWDKIVTAYSSSDLTFHTDKLIALSGIAQEVHKMIQSDYLAGLWSSHLPFNLMWHPNYYLSSYKRQEYVAPSWSWASIDDTYIWHIDSEKEDKKPHLVVLNYATTLANPQDPFGQIVDGYIEVRGKLGLAEWAIPSESQEDVTDITLSVTDAMAASDGCARTYEPKVFAMTRSESGAIGLDVVEDRERLREAYLLPLYTKVYGGEWKDQMEALLLLRQPCGRFVRVGAAWLDVDNGEEVLGSLLEHEITII